MATYSNDARLEGWELPDQRRSFLPRTLIALVTFSRRKPLGAFGALLIGLPVLGSLLLPGLDLGIVTLPRVLPYAHNEYVLGENILEGPSWEHPLGTDNFGRDQLARLLYGSRLSLFIGWSVFAISTVMSTSLTIISAYYIRTVDLIMQRLVEMFGFIPDLILIVALFSIYGATPLTLILTLGVMSGINTGRVLRSLVIGIRGQAYIEAARSIGASDKRIIVRHVLPQIAFWIIVSATNGIAAAVLVESGLAILGFGLSPDIPTLGNLLNSSRNFLRSAPYLVLAPGLMIFVILLGGRLLGDALRDVLDPRLRGSR